MQRVAELLLTLNSTSFSIVLLRLTKLSSSTNCCHLSKLCRRSETKSREVWLKVLSALTLIGPISTELVLLSEEAAASLKHLADVVLSAEKAAYNPSELLSKMLSACKVLRHTDLTSLPKVVQVFQGIALATKKVYEEGSKSKTLAQVRQSGGWNN